MELSLGWKDLQWLTEQTTLPVVVKGVLCVEDAELALEHGAAAVVVSNHGARQLDGAPAAIEVLPEIVEAVGDRAEVYVDGEMRSGANLRHPFSPALWRSTTCRRPLISLTVHLCRCCNLPGAGQRLGAPCRSLLARSHRWDGRQRYCMLPGLLFLTKEIESTPSKPARTPLQINYN